MDKEKFLDCNIMAAKLFNCSKDEIIGKTPFAFSPKYQDEERKILSETLAMKKINAALEGKPQIFEWKHKKKTGEVFYCEVKLNRFTVKNKIYILAIVRDIDNRKKMIANLERSVQIMNFQKMEIYHRVMNNLQYFKSFYKLLQRKGNYSEETIKLLKFLENSIHVYSAILQGIYDKKNYPVPLLNVILNKILSEWLEEKETKKINLELRKDVREIKSEINPIFNSMVIFWNFLILLRNKYLEEDKKIQLNITLQQVNDYFAKIVISDNGEYKLNNFEELFDGYERKISFYLFSNPINAKIIYERRDSKNYFVVTFKYKEGNEYGEKDFNS